MSRVFQRRRLGKKAQDDSQFNWIFILIAGSLILAFFIVIVMKQKSASDAKFAGKVSQQLNAILAGAKVSSGSVQTINTPEVSIRFTCNDYYIGPASQRLGNKIVFAPEFVEGNELMTWTLDWNVPFKAATFLYITNPRVRYVVVGNGPDAEKLYSALPKKMNKGKLISESELGKVIFDNDIHTRFIFVTSLFVSKTISDTFAAEDVSGLLVDMTNRKFQFMEKTGNSLGPAGTPQVYAEDELMYGAVFSNNAQEYSCLLKRAYNRLNLVSSVYYQRLLSMSKSFEAGSACEGFYMDNSDTTNQLKVLMAAAGSSADMPNLDAAKAKLKEQNKRLQLQSCPMIY
jgi:hypothetical protein